jgi:hypothetical protein
MSLSRSLGPEATLFSVLPGFASAAATSFGWTSGRVAGACPNAAGEKSVSDVAAKTTNSVMYTQCLNM